MLSVYDQTRAAALAKLFTAQELDKLTDLLPGYVQDKHTNEVLQIVLEAFDIGTTAYLESNN